MWASRLRPFFNLFNELAVHRAAVFDAKCWLSVSACLDTRAFRVRDKYSPRVKNVPIKIKLTENEDEDLPEQDEDPNEAELNEYIQRSLYLDPLLGHRILVVQPYIKWGREKLRLTTPQLQLEEAATLIKTLRTWKVVGTKLLGIRSWKGNIFGPGQLDDLKAMVSSNREITGVFISVNMLTPVQQVSLQNQLGVPVFDRYTIVINIFREHATSKEAKLQIKLAELPYIWSRMGSVKEGTLLHFGGGASVIGSTFMGKETYKQLLRCRESKIKDEIEKLKAHRKIVKKTRIHNEVPTIAIVGYTNAGKTCLIKSLTGKTTLEPQDYLFATLDITTHKGTLPSSLEVFYIDTIGFMSDIPPVLFNAFVATLEDVKLADVIIHVRDISHPDTVAQNANVLTTLDMILGLSQEQKENIITVGNKIDLVEESTLKKYHDEGLILISAKESIGTGLLEQKVEKKILSVTNRQIMVMKVKTSSEEYDWLHENATVIHETPFQENVNYMLLKVIITETVLAKFKHNFIKDYYKTR